MHLVPSDRAGRRVIDEQRVCKAISAVGEAAALVASAERFALLGDPHRLALLLAIHRAGPISVSDLAVAADINDTTASQALRFLRATGTVAAERDGRILRYSLIDDEVAELLDRVDVAPRGKRRAGAR